MVQQISTYQIKIMPLKMSTTLAGKDFDSPSQGGTLLESHFHHLFFVKKILKKNNALSLIRIPWSSKELEEETLGTYSRQSTTTCKQREKKKKSLWIRILPNHNNVTFHSAKSVEPHFQAFWPHRFG